MILDFNDVRKGKIIVFEGQPYRITSHAYLRKQQRRPVMKVTMKHLGTGATKEHSFMQSDKVHEADGEKRPYQFLYREAGKLTFMDQATYEQVQVEDSQMGDGAEFLKDGQEATVVLFEGKPVTVELPIKITRLVTEAAPGVRGDSAGSVQKEVTLEGGVKVRAPLFINEGDKIVIDTRSG
ncbi:MAG: elongation factor P, partial [Patescibacteria group bacterium]